MKGFVFDIKKFAIHDGPGIRTTLFLKGCPLGCLWCHNPEGIDGARKLLQVEHSCIGCGSCVGVCAAGALSLKPGGSGPVSLDRDLCLPCGACSEVCPTGALFMDSSVMTAEEAAAFLLEDRDFYGDGEGGVTLSGGDPLYQHKFAREVLRLCKEEKIHTAIETSMDAPREVLESFSGLVDLFIVDLKLMDDKAHRTYTGKGNGRILSNFTYLAGSGAPLLVRIPLIPDITATEGNLRAVCRFIRENSTSIAVELLNFNPLAEDKYRLLGKGSLFLRGLKPFGAREMNDFYSILEEEGLEAVRETAPSGL